MNYSNHNLKTELQEWVNRLSIASYDQFSNQLKYFLDNIDKNKQISSFIKEAIHQYPYNEERLSELEEQLAEGVESLIFDNLTDQSSFCYQFLKYFISKHNTYKLHSFIMFQRGKAQDTRNHIIEDFIFPILYFLTDKLDRSNSTIFLLEKYKKRTEWFTKENLVEAYSAASKNYEQLFEDDLRLFLFDQGIDYPFSTPSSASGRVDIIGEIETDNPLIIEIKIFDRNKNYGKDRIKDGFSQIVKYANDYHKDVGYLVIYNMDKVEINFVCSDQKNIFPPRINFNNKIFYFIVINLAIQTSASKSGVIQEIKIEEFELTKTT